MGTGSARELRKSRLGTDEYFLIMAKLASLRSTCARRAVGCVIVDAHNLVLATGYNGVPRGAVHCIEKPCAGAGLPSGTGLSTCESVHAEQNALLQCSDVDRIRTIYVTASPCITCMRMLANTSVRRIVYLEEYPHKESFDVARAAGIAMAHVPINFNDLEKYT
jgi:dCMP deaminase